MILIKENYFHLITKGSSYIIRILPDKTVDHCYYGRRISDEDMDYYHLFVPHDYTAPMTVGSDITTIDAIPQECPSCGRGDYRTPAVIIENNDGRMVSEFKYSQFKHYSGVPTIDGLPQLDKNTENVETLELVLHDTISGVSLHLYYSVFEDIDIIARHMRINNCSGKAVTLRRALSASLDFESNGFDMISLAGRWACERSVERMPLRSGKTIISSSRGASGHNLSPFAALARKNTDEDYGEVYAMTLVYSGNFELGADVGQFGSTRFFAGIGGKSFSWKLQNEEEFVTPQALLTYSSEGLAKMSHNFHNACRGHLGVCTQGKKHPVLLNLWEAFYFDVTEEEVIKSIKAVRGTGIDTVVLDDGWFGKRINDESSLGDWFINKDKFPGGFEAIISECRSSGLKFGLWFEPEMISEDSELYRKHPDWCIKIDGITPVKSRNELVLDMSRPEVVDSVYKQLSRIIRDNGISYIKWDMNRNITDCGSVSLEPDRQGEHSHRYILGVYSLMERLTKKFPNVFFEGCAGGGGRFDFGILYYMPQIWASDNSDAIARLKIQYGTSMVFPPETMSAHISDCPNHQTGRITPISTRGNVAQLFSFGYEFDPSEITLNQRRNISDEIAKHRAYEGWIGNADFYRLIDPFSTNRCAWQAVSADKSHSAVLYVMQLAEANPCGEYLRLKGLDPKKRYRVIQKNIVATGDVLMNAGIPLRKKFSDFESVLLNIIEL